MAPWRTTQAAEPAAIGVPVEGTSQGAHLCPIEAQSYAFALSPDSPLRKPLSIEILHTIQSDEWTEARVRYLGEEPLGFR